MSGDLLRDGRVVGRFSLDEHGNYEGAEPRTGDHVRVDPWRRHRRDDEFPHDVVLPRLPATGPESKTEPAPR